MKQHGDIRWIQRFNNFQKALEKLNKAVLYCQDTYYEEGVLNPELLDVDDIIIEGLIQRFEYTHELSWKVIKDFVESKGNSKIYGSKDATREGFQLELISNGHVWMNMIKSRNNSSHTYNYDIAIEIFRWIIDDYHREFNLFNNVMIKLAKLESL